MDGNVFVGARESVGWFGEDDWIGGDGELEMISLSVYESGSGTNIGFFGVVSII